MLGFPVAVLVDDPDGAAERVSADLLAVVREGLANVARHAAASSATVELRTTGDEVVLTVTDDGAGMGDAGRSSGTGNVRARAREHGGDCVWVDMRPSGTEMRWRVPVADTVLA